MGTPAYMAPEQLAGERVTAAADMWSWAVSMTFAGTGKLPFTGESLTAMAFAILNGEPSVGRLPEPLGSHRSSLPRQGPGSSALRPRCAERARRRGSAAHGPAPAAGPTNLAVDDEAANPARSTNRAARVPQRVAGARLEARRAGQGIRQSRRGSIGHARRRWRATALVASILLISGAGGLTLLLSRHSPVPGRSTSSPAVSSQELASEASARTRAITWILQQVSRATVLSCDPQMCADLAQRGFPNLETLGPGSTDPLGSTLVVATGAIRAQFGRAGGLCLRSGRHASFGSGNAKIEIRWASFPGGTSAYRAALEADLRAPEDPGRSAPH